MNPLEALQEWYQSQCNGDWEHKYGINIESCDNPGWWVKIDLMGTSLQSRHYPPIKVNIDERGFQKEPRWLSCCVIDGVWHGSGDETKLPEIVSYFLRWANEQAA